MWEPGETGRDLPGVTGAAGPDAARPDLTRPGVTELDLDRPDLSRPDLSQLDSQLTGQLTGQLDETRADAAGPGVTRALDVVMDLFGAKAAELWDAIRSARPRDETGPLFWEVDRTTVWMTRVTRFVSDRSQHDLAPAAPAATLLEMFRAKAAGLLRAVRRRRPRDETTPLFLEVDRMTVWMGRLTSFVAAQLSPGRSRRDPCGADINVPARYDLPGADGTPGVGDARGDGRGAGGAGGPGGGPDGGGIGASHIDPSDIGRGHACFAPPDLRAAARAVMSAPASVRAPRPGPDPTDELIGAPIGALASVPQGVPESAPRPPAPPRTRLDGSTGPGAGRIPQTQIPPEQARRARARPHRTLPDRTQSDRPRLEDRDEAAGPVDTVDTVEAVDAADTGDAVHPVDAVEAVDKVDTVDTVEKVAAVDTVHAVAPVDSVDAVDAAGPVETAGALEARARSRSPAAGDGRVPGHRGGRGRVRERAAASSYAASMDPGVGERADARRPEPGPRGARGGGVMTTGPPG